MTFKPHWLLSPADAEPWYHGVLAIFWAAMAVWFWVRPVGDTHHAMGTFAFAVWCCEVQGSTYFEKWKARQ